MSGCRCFFVSDLHGSADRYRALLTAVERERPRAVLIGGDLLPFDLRWPGEDFVAEFLLPSFAELKRRLGCDAPSVLLILGNDDPREREAALLAAQSDGIWEYLHGRWTEVDGFDVAGYSCVPPTPFMLKDWERYDVSRFVDPGSVAPEEGRRTVAVDPSEVQQRTIMADLDRLAGDRELSAAVFLFHSPPYRTALDRAALDGRMVDHVPVDVHVGSIAISRFIADRQPLLTLHGHIHEAARLTGSWRVKIGRTHAISAAHDGPELALVRFDLDDLDAASRELI